MYVQMELCGEGTLRDQMAVETLSIPRADAVAWTVLAHVSAGLAHIHANGMLHCDIKPDNVLIASVRGQLVYKVGDLGQATFVTQWDEHEGDARYLSRDLLNCRPSAAADVFSLGISMLEVKSGRELPGHGQAWEALRRGGPLPLEDSCTASDALRALIEAMMAVDPDARPSAVDVGQVCAREAAVSQPLVSPRRMTPRPAMFLSNRSKMVLRWLLGTRAANAHAKAQP